jgi:hypothetical protein
VVLVRGDEEDIWLVHDLFLQPAPKASEGTPKKATELITVTSTAIKKERV